MLINQIGHQQQAVGPFHLILSLLILFLTAFPCLFNGHNKYGSVSAYYNSDDINLKHAAIDRFDLLDIGDVVWSKAISTRDTKLIHSYMTNDINDQNHSDRKFDNAISASSGEPIEKLQFYSLGRHFNLRLSKPRHLISKDLTIDILDADNKKTRINYDSNQLQVLNGLLAGEPASMVTASLDKRTKLITAHINTGHEMIIVEPASMHSNSLTPNSQLYNQTMIVYNLSDHKHFKSDSTENLFDLEKLCPYIKLNETLREQDFENTSINNLSQSNFRSKRSIEQNFKDRTRCTLHIVADYLFYKHVGNGDLQSTINYILALVNRVNQIYLPTTWEAGDDWTTSSIGFTIQNITIHQQYTKQSFKEFHYNMQSDKVWTAREFLDNFSRNSPPSSFCLAHLLTYRKFDAPVLGLAYVASSRPYTIGGICSPPQLRGDAYYRHNTGISTSQGFSGDTLITRQADLVVAHELGHNFGAEHDSNECRPSSSKGGAYLMHPFAVMGFEKNNRRMSNCSLISIGRVIKNKRSCFVAVVDHLCGNGVVEDDEECDGGGIGFSQEDPCCDSNCRLTPLSKCSDRHSWCCNKCQINPFGVLCRPAEPDNCKQAGFCDGHSAECPSSPPPVEDNSVCVGRGLCKDGDCKPFCEARGLFSCLCNNPTDACKLCCKSSLNGTCVPYDQKAPYLPDGVLCYRGVCEKGRCEQAIQDAIERLWDIIEDVNYRTVIKFLRDNIILVVILSSIPIWLFITHYIDKFDQKVKHDVYNAIITSRSRKRPNESPFLPRLFVGEDPGGSNEFIPQPEPKSSSAREHIGFKPPQYGFKLAARNEDIFEPASSIPLATVEPQVSTQLGDNLEDEPTNSGDTYRPYSTQV